MLPLQVTHTSKILCAVTISAALFHHYRKTSSKVAKELAPNRQKHRRTRSEIAKLALKLQSRWF